MPTLLPNAKQTFTGPNGTPLSGGSVYFYIPSTTTFKDTFQDPAQTILNTNPVILDANGQAIIWGSGVYRQQVFDVNNNLIWDQITEDTSAGLLGNITDNRFLSGSGFTPGTTTQLTLSSGPGTIANTWVYFDGVYQTPDTYSLSGLTITFTSPIPVGVQEVNIKAGNTIAIGIPANGSVGAAQLAWPLAGSTSARPTPQTIGQLYYDETLGQEIVATSLSPVTWKNASGSPPIAANVIQFGADPTGVADSTAAFNAAVASCDPSKINVYFPAGTYYFATPPSVSMTSTQTAPASVSIWGAGSGVTQFKFASSGFTILYGSVYTGVHIEGISFLSPIIGGSSALTLEQNATFATGQGQYNLSTLRDLEFRGDDGWNEAHYWQTAINIAGASNINVADCTFYGPTGTPSGTGINLGYAPNDHTIIPIVFNVDGCSFTHLQSGIIYGGNCQGLSITKSNFTANFGGIIVPTGSSAVDQLLVSGSQFNNINDSILCQALCQAVSITNSFFLITDNAVGINVAISANTSIVGNIFSTADGTPTNQQAVQFGTYNQGASVVTGNQFNGLTIGVELLAASQFVTVLGNCYSGNGTNVNNLGTNNSVGVAVP